jgi:hypothetical protein
MMQGLQSAARKCRKLKTNSRQNATEMHRFLGGFCVWQSRIGRLVAALVAVQPAHLWELRTIYAELALK